MCDRPANDPNQVRRAVAFGGRVSWVNTSRPPCASEEPAWGGRLPAGGARLEGPLQEKQEAEKRSGENDQHNSDICGDAQGLEGRRLPRLRRRLISWKRKRGHPRLQVLLAAEVKEQLLIPFPVLLRDIWGVILGASADGSFYRATVLPQEAIRLFELGARGGRLDPRLGGTSPAGGACRVRRMTLALRTTVNRRSLEAIVNTAPAPGGATRASPDGGHRGTRDRGSRSP